MGSVAGVSFDRMRRVFINTLESEIDIDVLRNLPKFPIEGQIVSFSMYMFNEAQRPEYLMNKGYLVGGISEEKITEFRNALDVLKLSLASSNVATNLIRNFTAGPFSFRSPLKVSPNYEVGSRLPKSIGEVREKIKYLSDIGNLLVVDSSHIGEFSEILAALSTSFASDIGVMTDEFGESERFVRGDGEYAEFKDEENIEFWLCQRVVLMVLAMVGGFSTNKNVTDFIKKRLSMPSNLEWPDIMGRIYRHVSEFDQIFVQANPDDFRVSFYFIDPLVKWRHATSYYQLSDFARARSEIEKGIVIYEKRRNLGIENTQDVHLTFFPC